MRKKVILCVVMCLKDYSIENNRVESVRDCMRCCMSKEVSEVVTVCAE